MIIDVADNVPHENGISGNLLDRESDQLIDATGYIVNLCNLQLIAIRNTER